jgi:hypothetical protein
MSTHVLGAVSGCAGSLYGYEGPENRLASWSEELAELRYSIILTAKWEAAASEDVERREVLRDELVDLRSQYFEKIDEIAMTFGVQSAMDAKEEVERRVNVPSGVGFLFTSGEDESRCM